MPRRAKGPRLWLRPARRDENGQVTHTECYFVLDGGRQLSVGSAELGVAEQALRDHITKKHKRHIATGLRDTADIPVADVIALYAAQVAKDNANPKATKHRLKRVLGFFGHKELAEINGQLCRDYAEKSSTDAMARRDLEDLRAAINHHREEGLHDRIVSVVLPPARPPRERWLERDEAAVLLWTAWRRPKCKQVARFILIALYTGRRASVVCRASFKKEQGRPWIDTRRGFLWPPERTKITKKRNPPIPLADRLLLHLRAWERNGARYVVEWGGHAVTRVDKTVRLVAEEAGLEYTTPHVFRHTAATWQMQAGTDLLEAARYLGMTVKTLEKNYAHHRPEHLSAARDAYSRMKRQRFANVSREQVQNKKPRNNATNRGVSRIFAPA